MKSVQFRQSLNLPVGLTYIFFVALAALPDFVVHFLPMSERLSPMTTTVYVRNGRPAGEPVVVMTALSIAVSSPSPPGDARRDAWAATARTLARPRAGRNRPTRRYERPFLCDPRDAEQTVDVVEGPS
jgi:hypothetical protein